jgi:drug/metabolite transporter (DMT)-like permease
MLGFSFTLTATRAAVGEMSGVFVGCGRAVVAAALALVVLAVRRDPFPSRKHWAPLVRTALGVVIGFPTLSALALTSVPASHAQVFLGLSPIATAAMAVLRAGERPPRAFWGSALAGAVAVSVFGWLHAGGGLRLADALLVVAVVLVGFGYAEGGQLARELGGLRVVSWALIVSLPITLPATLWAMVDESFEHVSARALYGFLYVSLFSMYLAFVAWYRGLSLGKIARLSQVQLAMPVLGVGWAALFLNENVELSTVLSGAAVIGCSLWAQRTRFA